MPRTPAMLLALLMLIPTVLLTGGPASAGVFTDGFLKVEAPEGWQKLAEHDADHPLLVLAYVNEPGRMPMISLEAGRVEGGGDQSPAELALATAVALEAGAIKPRRFDGGVWFVGAAVDGKELDYHRALMVGENGRILSLIIGLKGDEERLKVKDLNSKRRAEIIAIWKSLTCLDPAYQRLAEKARQNLPPEFFQ